MIFPVARSKRILWLSVWVLLAAIAGALIHYPMTWGLMDDAHNLNSVQVRWPGMSVFAVLHQESTLLWFRPVYTFFVYVAYGTFQNHPQLFYVCNYLFICLACVPWIILIRRHHLPEFSPADAALLFVIFLLASTPLYNLVIYLSLQEKFILLFGGGAMLLLDSSLRLEEGGTVFQWWGLQFSAAACFVLGLWSKPTTIAFTPWAVLALFFAKRPPASRRFPAIALWVVPALGMARSFLRRKDDYSAHYNTDWHVLPRLLMHQPKFFYVSILVACVSFVLIWRRHNPPGSWLILPRPLLWPVSLVVYLGLLVPWGIATYLWVPAMVLLSGCLVFICEEIVRAFQAYWQGIGTALAAVALAGAAIVVVRVGVGRIARQSEIGPVVSWLRARLPDPHVDVFMMEPCLEASHGLEHFAGGNQPFQYLKCGEKVITDKPAVWLVTRDECPVDSSHQQEFNQVVFQSPHWVIYQKKG